MGRCIYGRMCEWEGVSVGECGSVYMWAGVGEYEWEGVSMGECGSVYMWAGVYMGERVSGQV